MNFDWITHDILDAPAMRSLLRNLRPVAWIVLGLTLSLVSAAVSGPAPAAQPATPASPSFTPTPQDASVIGSTDGIVWMGIFILLIVLIPLLAERRVWAG